MHDDEDGFWQPAPLRPSIGQVANVELKVVVPEHEGRSLVIDSRQEGPVRRVYFLDTADLALYRQGMIIRFRDRPRRHDDAVVKLRPVKPRQVPGWLRGADRFRVEIDALPDRAVCSGALKERLGRKNVSRAVAAGRPLTRLLSRQRKLLTTFAPPGLNINKLAIIGPIDVRRHNMKLRGLDRRLTVERWRYPDGSTPLEVSTRCRSAT